MTPTFFIAWIVALITAFCLLPIVWAAHAGSLYDRNGSFAGSTSKRGNSTTFTDRNGRFNGTAIRNSNGTTSFYDRNGSFAGSRSR